MKEKVKTIFNGNYHSDEEYNKFVAIPDIIDENTRHQTLMPRVAAQWEIDLAADIRVKAMAAESKARTQSRRDPWVQKSLKSRERGGREMDFELEGEDDDDDDILEDEEDEDEDEDNDDDDDEDGDNDSEEIEEDDDDIDISSTRDG